MSHHFQVVRVQGRVRWVDQGFGDAQATLILKRFNSRQKCGQVKLAEYVRGSSSDEITSLEFDLKPDAQNTFWQAGAAGTLVTYCGY